MPRLPLARLSYGLCSVYLHALIFRSDIVKANFSQRQRLIRFCPSVFTILLCSPCSGAHPRRSFPIKSQKFPGFWSNGNRCLGRTCSIFPWVCPYKRGSRG